ncbi:Hypothetical_protein [Hexamita inflata]|uniref:Hypothetical_protein n=1 Tax=Hexamita inflata TaxID=28002 RepID=A0AA86PGN7_9EUKA|nr:Hypothetical protein HINF_LOCUS26810 [Hexamita inflata]
MDVGILFQGTGLTFFQYLVIIKIESTINHCTTTIYVLLNKSQPDDSAMGFDLLQSNNNIFELGYRFCTSLFTNYKIKLSQLYQSRTRGDSTELNTLMCAQQQLPPVLVCLTFQQQNFKQLFQEKDNILKQIAVRATKAACLNQPKNQKNQLYLSGSFCWKYSHNFNQSILKQLSHERSVGQLSQQFVENLEFIFCIELNYNRMKIKLSLYQLQSIFRRLLPAQLYRYSNQNFKVKTMAFQFVK